MGKRIEGKTKRKSFKSKVTSKSNMEKKVSRMGKKVKKGMMGPSTDFMTRSSVLKKLQITLKDFRRLCILKGIYPRVPDGKAPKGADKVYYDIKDVAYLAHEPLLHKFREFKSFMKKIRREAGRYQYQEARRKNELKPVMNLDHLVKERYPRFIDALRDLDDCLSMIHLFAALPSVGRITAEKTKGCYELARHWQYYVARTRSLQKVFVSVKGVYFQANILGEPITWLVPHQFAQAIPKDVDLRVMATFLEFYEVFLRFTLFKLYHLQGLQYPPKTDKSLHEAGCFLLSIRALSLDGSSAAEKNSLIAIENKPQKTVEKTKGKLDPVQEERMKSLYEKMSSIAKHDDADEDEDDDEENEVSISGPLSETLQGLFPSDNDDQNEDAEETKTFSALTENNNVKSETRLFSKFKFFINREVPLDWMQLCIISFGGQVGWEGQSSPYTIDDPSITHHIIDRPVQGQQNKSREYIQPQWVFDSINVKLPLPVQKYSPGSILPPHLSPFVDESKEGYTPKYVEELEKMKSAVQVIKSGTSVPVIGNEVPEENNQEDDEEEDYDEAKYQKNLKKEKHGVKTVNRKLEVAKSEEGEENEDDENLPETVTKGVVYKPSQAKLSEDQESKELAQIMMSKKSKRLYGRIQHGIQKKKESSSRLEEKRKALEDNDTTHTVKKQKVEKKGSKNTK